MFYSSVHRSQSQAAPPEQPRQMLGEYWFVAAPARGTSHGDDFKIKFVNLEDYRVSKPREGWLTVKRRGLRWVMLKVN